MADWLTNHLRVAGDIINCTAAFLPGNDSLPYMCNAVAAADSLILDFPISWLKNAVQNYNIIALNLLSALSQRAANMELEAKNQARMSSQQLLACFLTRTCVIEGHDPKGFDPSFQQGARRLTPAHDAGNALAHYPET